MNERKKWKAQKDALCWYFYFVNDNNFFLKCQFDEMFSMLF
jgi:hypothetical protein